MLLRALRSRSTRSGQLEAENHQEQSTGVREAAENLLEIESTISARAAPELERVSEVGLSRALGARVAPEAIVVVVCRSWACPQCMSLSCVHLDSLGEVGRGHVHVVSFSRAGSVPGISVDWGAALAVLLSLHVCMRACILLCYCGASMRTF